MKRCVVTGILLVVLACLLLLLNGKIADSEDYSGIWYRTSDGVQYVFEKGMIRCQDCGLQLADDPALSGAYSYGKDSVVLFFADRNGVGEVLELKLVHRWTGDVLCDYRDGHKQVLFCRNQKTAHLQ